MALDRHHAISYYYRDAIGDDFMQCPDDIRIVHIIRFDPTKREVIAEKLWSGPFNREKIQSGEIVPTDEDLLNSEGFDDLDLQILPPPLVNPATLKCLCDDNNGDLDITCKTRTSRRKGRPDRLQAICARGRCKYKQWVDIAHIQCNCRPAKPAVLLKAGGRNKPENKGKEYFRCADKLGPDNYGCGYFKWKEALQSRLSEDWGKKYMTVDQALQILLEGYKADKESLKKMPYDVVSTLVGYCSCST